MEEIKSRSCLKEVKQICDALMDHGITTDPLEVGISLIVATIAMNYLDQREVGVPTGELEAYLTDAYTAVTATIVSSIEASIDANTKLPPERIN